VVRSNRTLAFDPGSKNYEKQKGLLEKEGVKVINGKVIPLESDDDQRLDELMWGPGETDAT
jgi:alkylated DNA nucleotide flippase Atl1